jgi:excisionase family DNA binding protein
MAKQKTHEPPKARRLDDASRVSGLSRSYFYKLERLGKIKLVRVGGRTLMPEAELNRLLQFDGGEAA